MRNGESYIEPSHRNTEIEENHTLENIQTQTVYLRGSQLTDIAMARAMILKVSSSVGYIQSVVVWLTQHQHDPYGEPDPP